nr:bifunctional uridylate/adenylate kinase [Polyrhizophydium stewartii]
MSGPAHGGSGGSGGSGSGEQPKPGPSALQLPLMLLAGAGLASAVYYWWAARSPSKNRTTGPESAHEGGPTLGKLAIDPAEPGTTVVFVLGGPGAGKGTQCARLVQDFGFVHLSAGDLLREERNRPGSPYGELINTYIKEGKIVPMEITIALLRIAMSKSGGKRFLVDGFPRQMDQALKFEELVCESKIVLYFECPEEEMLKRLLKRGETSGRVDDNIESIRKRFETFRDTSYPVIEYYDKIGKVKKVSCLNPVDKVYAQTRRIFDEMFK